MGLIIDIALIAVVVISAILAWRKGFARVLIEAIGYIVALVLAFSLSLPIANAIYDGFIRDEITVYAENIFENIAQNNMSDEISTALGEDASQIDIENVELPQNLSLEDIQNAFVNMPENLAGITNTFDITAERTYLVYQEHVTAGITNVNLATVLTTELIGPPAVMVIRGITIVVLMVIFMIIVRVISKFISAILFKTPLVGSVNRILGFAFGVLRGIIFALLIGVALIPLFYFVLDNSGIVDTSQILSFVRGVMQPSL